jgi:hypothetical protein
MNLPSWNNQESATKKKVAAATGIFRQNGRHGLKSNRLMMLLYFRVRNLAICLLGALGVTGAFTSFSQTNYYTTNGTEYAIVSSLPGDQVYPSAAISPTGGFLVWEDNITDGSGLGVSAMAVDGTLSGSGNSFRVNVTGANDQENPHVALLKKGGAAFVWQGGVEGSQHIYARFLSPSNLWLNGSDVLVNASTNNFQVTPAVATLANGNVIVVWGSFDEAGSGSMQDVYGQILTTNGTKVGGEFLINQYISYNQRTPTVAALPNGGFVVAWVSEQERILAPTLDNNINTNAYLGSTSAVKPSVDIYARIYNSNGVSTNNEFLVDTGSNPCADPAVAVASDGSYLIAWCAQDMITPNNGYDVYGHIFTNNVAAGGAFYINSTLSGDQYIPQVSVIGQDYLVAWTSLGQDGSREGIYAQSIHADGTLVGGEFRVNTTTVGQQMEPAIASDGVDQFLAVWTSFASLTNGFDLFAQRYVNSSGILVALPAPFVWAPFTISNNAYLPQLVVSWTPVEGLSVSNYEVYVNGAGSPMAIVATNQWTMTAANGLTTSSTNSFQVDYVLAGGRRSPLSPSATGATWGGGNWFGVPFEWMVAYYGLNAGSWPLGTANLGGGMTLSQVFKSGGDPLDPGTWLQTSLNQTIEGMYLSWNTQPGATYQVINSTNLTTWSNVGSPRFAAGTVDSIYVGGKAAGYYRVVLLR